MASGLNEVQLLRELQHHVEFVSPNTTLRLNEVQFPKELQPIARDLGVSRSPLPQ